jgi:hypothetical protein
MHTIKIDPWRFRHNGDFVGTVVVTNEGMPDFAGEDVSDWLNAALTEVERLRAENATARDLLRRVEWREEGAYCGDSVTACPFCDAEMARHSIYAPLPELGGNQGQVAERLRGEHAAGCPLAAFLGRRLVAGERPFDGTFLADWLAHQP